MGLENRDPMISRRQFLQAGTVTVAGLALAACSQPAPVATPVVTPVATIKPAAAAQPAPPVLPASGKTVVIAAPQPEPTVRTMRAPEPNPKRGGTLRTAWGVTTSNFDVHQGGSSSVLCVLYNNLVRLNLADGLKTIIPDLAERWEVAGDARTYTFHLRDKVKFHDGMDFTSADPVANFRRILNPPAGMTSMYREMLSGIDTVEAVDRLTVRFVLKRPSPIFLELLTNPAMVIYSKKTLDENNQDLRKVIAPGTGAFVFKEHRVAEKWVFERNPNYWDPELPYIDRIEMIHVPGWTDRGTAILTGQADLSWNVSVDTFEEGKKRSDTVSTSLMGNYGALDVTWNARKAPYNDVRVRRALHLAINRHDAVKAYREEAMNVTRWMSRAAEGATPAEELVKLPGYRADNREDIAEAKKLLAEAGFPDGSGFPVMDLVAASVPGHSEVLAPFYSDQLRRGLNIEVKIRVVERALITQEYKKDFNVVLGTLFNSPAVSPAPMWSTCWKTGGSQNWSGYSNPQFDKVVDQLSEEMDVAKRAQLFRKGEELLDANPPQYHFGFTDHAAMWRNYVKGLALEQRPYREWGRMETVWLDR